LILDFISRHYNNMSYRSYGSAQDYYGIANLLRHFKDSMKEYFRSIRITLLFVLVGAIVALGAREMLQRDDLTMNSGMAILLTLCASFVQFAGSQESYSARSNAVAAFTALEQACVSARVGRCEEHMYAALIGRRDAANGVEVRQIDSSGATVSTRFKYLGGPDLTMQRFALTNEHTAAALQSLAAFDVLCRVATPRTMTQPINDMYILTFAFVMPLTIFPVMGWWYLLFSVYPTFICVGSYYRMCEAGNFLNRRIPEYNALFEETIAMLKIKTND
jgi:hypothetical protein